MPPKLFFFRRMLHFVSAENKMTELQPGTCFRARLGYKVIRAEGLELVKYGDVASELRQI